MNKRFCLTLAAMFLGVAAAAQPFELGVSTGTSVNGSSQVDTSIDISYIFTIMPDLELGLGTGMRYARPLYDKKTTRIITNKDGTTADNTNVDKMFLNEITIPMFVRIRYSATHNLFLQADAGHRFRLFSIIDYFPVPESVTGWFIDPQIGYRLSPKRAISLGLQLQGGKHHEIHHTIDRTDGVRISSHSKLNNTVRPIAFIRYTKSL